SEPPPARESHESYCANSEIARADRCHLASEESAPPATNALPAPPPMHPSASFVPPPPLPEDAPSRSGDAPVSARPFPPRPRRKRRPSPSARALSTRQSAPQSAQD